VEVEWSHENQAMQAAITTDSFSSLPKRVARAKISKTTYAGMNISQLAIIIIGPLFN
jgi:hypothetical protein